MTAKFGYVTTACRLCEDIVPPDGDDLWCGAIDGPFCPSVQQVLAYVCQRLPKRNGNGPLRWKRPTESHDQHTRLKSGPAHPFASARHVPLLQSLTTRRQKIDTISSRETTELPFQRRVCGRLQQIPPREERRSVHRFQQARGADATREEQPSRAAAQVLLSPEGSPRLRHKQTQYCDRRHRAQVASAA
ncbi:unnamed protein product [Leptosia nina]|uniref:Uncharacterized protein n=1 Tax=Leptosia nina TaxID=320188 RepID=A0AAV1K2N6_9NEOP